MTEHPTRFMEPYALRAAALAALLCVLLQARPAYGQSAAAADEVRAVERAWLDAYENHDVEAMENIVADGFVITYPGGQQRDRAETIASLNPGQPDDPNSRMYTTDDAVTFFGDDIAVIRGTFHFEVTNADGSVQLDSSLYTDVYKRMDGRWKVISSHLSKPAQAN